MNGYLILICGKPLAELHNNNLFNRVTVPCGWDLNAQHLIKRQRYKLEGVVGVAFRNSVFKSKSSGFRCHSQHTSTLLNQAVLVCNCR